MLYVVAAFGLSAVGILMKGLLHLSLADVVVILALPVMFLYKLLGNRPSFFAFGGIIGSFAGGISAFYGYVIVPIQYYYELWGWMGVVLGVVAFLLFIIPELILFLVVAYIKGEAAVYIGEFFSGICFGIAGVCLLNSAFSWSIWSRFSRKKSDEAL